MKPKIIALILSAALLLGVVLPAFAAGSMKYVVTAAYANLLPEPNAALSPIATVPLGTLVEVLETQAV